MHVAIAVGTLLLGGWVLHSPVDEEESAEAERAQPPVTYPAYPSLAPQRPSTFNRGQRRLSLEDQGRRLRAEGAEREPGRPGAEYSAKEGRRAPGMMPSAPTDGAALDAEGALAQPAAPTASANVADTILNDAARSGAFRSVHPMVPTAGGTGLASGTPAQSPFRPAMHGMMGQNRGQQMQGGTAGFMGPPVATAPVQKAFAGYQAPSGVSPYMNIFRPSFGGVDSYHTLVQPQLQQRSLNQQFGRDIGGLERNTRTQAMTLQQLNQANRAPQGVSTPQYYMNLGNYYPGYGQ